MKVNILKDLFYFLCISGSFCTTIKTNINKQQTATIAKELLNAGTSPTADALAKSGGKSHTAPKPIPQPVTPATTATTTEVIRPKDQLMYLAQLLGFQVKHDYKIYTTNLQVYSSVSFAIDTIFRLSER